MQDGAGFLPAVKFSFKDSAALLPDPQHAAPRTYTFTLRIPTSSAGACADLRTLCGGCNCLAALADDSYKSCPAYTLQHT